ncbi:MAG TPA: hypothetical protein VEE84_05475, partial [Burkholderiaceae bacterium]|nr:hypothetical protein [Burkholderiaceae bacterium]
KIVGEILHNYGKIRQTQLKISVSYDADLPQALATVEERVRAHPRVLREPQAQIAVASLGDSSVLIIATFWVSVVDFGSVDGGLYLQIIEALRERGIEIALPQSQVRLLEPVKSPS